jgi:hypothetical protein
MGSVTANHFSSEYTAGDEPLGDLARFVSSSTGLEVRSADPQAHFKFLKLGKRGVA